MARYLGMARLHLVLVLIFAAIRFGLGAKGVPYEKGTIVSIVLLTLLSALFHGAFTRRWRGYRLAQAMSLGVTLGIVSQLVILLATALSYGLGMETYFNNPQALNDTQAVAFATAMGRRLGGLVVNTILATIAAALGWALGALLPESA